MSSSPAQETRFALLPRTRTPWTEFVLSTGMQALVVAFILWVRLLYPAVILVPEHSFRSVELVSTPVPVSHKPQPVRMPLKLSITAHVEPTANALRLPEPRKISLRELPRAENDAAPLVRIAAKVEPLAIRSSPVIPKAGVQTNVFSTGSSAVPSMERPVAQVQTGGFGDPNGTPAKSNSGKAVNIAAAGSFDLPPGPGSGNGNGGTKGERGVTVSSGFGNGAAIGSQTRASSRTFQVSGFAAANGPALSATRLRPGASSENAVAAEILSKPTPVYSPEARSLRIEGEVLLEVVLGASGSLHVVRVVHGLGHGLDDNAVKAAEQIHFKPAMRNGQPTDSTVVLHIVFQLA